MKTFALRKTQSCGCKSHKFDQPSMSYRPIKVKFRWKAQIGSACDNGDPCGGCPGFCVSIPIGSYSYRKPISKGLVNEGWGIAMVSHENNLLHLIPMENIDNGDGFVRIDDNFSIPGSIFNYKKDLTVRKGKYKVQYSPEYPFGFVLMTTL